MTRPTIPRRLVDQQRRLRQAGRIRAGYSEATGKVGKTGREIRRPVKSPTFILTSQQRGDLDIAAQRWGGEIDRWQPQGGWPEVWRLMTDTDTIEALLPAGDPLMSLYEYWSGPNCARRCDSVTEYIGDLSTLGETRPCVCVATLGADWGTKQLSEQDRRNACKLTTRLNVYLPTGDLAFWRLDVHSWYAAQEMIAIVDLIKARIGPDHEVPVRLRIEQRSEPGKDYQVVVIEVHSQVARQILSGVVPSLALDGEPTSERRPAIEAPTGQPAPQNGAQNRQPAPVPAGQPQQPETVAVEDSPPKGALDDLAELIGAAMTEDALKSIWNQVAVTKNNDLKNAWYNRRTKIRNGTAVALTVTEAAVAASDAVDGETEPDRTAVWTQILALAGERGWDQPTVSQLMRETVGHDPSNADGWAFGQFLAAIKEGKVTTP